MSNSCNPEAALDDIDDSCHLNQHYCNIVEELTVNYNIKVYAWETARDLHRRKSQQTACFSFFSQPFRLSLAHLQMAFGDLQPGTLRNITTRPSAIELRPSYRTRRKYFSLQAPSLFSGCLLSSAMTRGKLRPDTFLTMSMRSSRAPRCLLALLNLALLKMSA